MVNNHCGFVVRVSCIRPHSNADKLQIATFFGNDTVVGLDVKEGDLGIYFPSDLQLSEEFCDFNHMCRKKADGTDDTGYLDRSKRNIKTIKLRGEYSDGILCPIYSLSYTGVDLNSLDVGDVIDVVNGHEICKKYIPRITYGNSGEKKLVTRHKQKFEMPFFAEHIDTPQLQYCEGMFNQGDVICLTEKVHGTSSRNAHTIVYKHKKNIFDRIFKRPGRVCAEYKYIVGTRRTVVDDSANNDSFRVKWANLFKGKLELGEEVFGEIAGFTDDNHPIMGTVSNSKVNDKSFVKRYGCTTTFSYGCDIDSDSKPQNRYFIYRMTYTSQSGFVIEYPWDFVKLRAEQMGFEVVPELERFVYTTREDMMSRINKYLDIPSTIDPRHIIEGVVVRALNSPNDFKAAKIKSRNFKIIEGIIKDEATSPDMEECDG